jgi:hypothetical protein
VLVAEIVEEKVQTGSTVPLDIPKGSERGESAEIQEAAFES